MKSTNSKKKRITKTKIDEYYTKEEIKRLDEIHEKTDHKYDDDEVYPLIQKYKKNYDAIIKELKERNETYGWKYVGKGNYIVSIYIFYRRKINSGKTRRKK